MKLLMLALVLVGCVDTVEPIGCGPMPRPVPLFLVFHPHNRTSHVELTAEQWLDRQAWTSDIIAWGECMRDR